MSAAVDSMVSGISVVIVVGRWAEEDNEETVALFASLRDLRAVTEVCNGHSWWFPSGLACWCCCRFMGSVSVGDQLRDPRPPVPMPCLQKGCKLQNFSNTTILILIVDFIYAPSFSFEYELCKKLALSASQALYQNPASNNSESTTHLLFQDIKVPVDIIHACISLGS